MSAGPSFDASNYLKGLDEKVDARVGRVLLDLMHRPPRNEFDCELAPVAFELTYTLLANSVRQVLREVGLVNPAYVSNSDGKVGIKIPASALSDRQVQQKIAFALEKAHQKASQLGL